MISRNVVRTKHLKHNSDQQTRPLCLDLPVEASRKRKRKWGLNDLLTRGAPQTQRNINVNEIDIGSEDLQACSANEASQAPLRPTSP